MIIEMRTYRLKPGSVAEVEKRFGEAMRDRAYAYSAELAKEALTLAAAKLPVKTRFIERIAE